MLAAGDGVDALAGAAGDGAALGGAAALDAGRFGDLSKKCVPGFGAGMTTSGSIFCAGAGAGAALEGVTAVGCGAADGDGRHCDAFCGPDASTLTGVDAASVVAAVFASVFASGWW